MNWQSIVNRYVLPSAVILLYFFIYIPLGILVLFSFNKSAMQFTWGGVTTEWYTALWHTPEIWDALYNSLIIASSAVFLSISMGSLFIFFCSHKYVRPLRMLFFINLGVPEIVLAVGLMSFFYFVAVPLSFVTIIAAHTILGLGYVVPIIYDRYSDLDKRYMEASLDLGATAWQTFRFIVLPLLYPTLFASAILVFIISFDDFLLSFFCSGGETQTLPMYIFALIRSGSSPMVSSLSTLLLLGSSIVVLLFFSFQSRRSGMMQ